MIRFFLLFALILHTLFTIYVCLESGYLSLFPPFHELATYQIFIDLCLASSLVLLLLYLDARRTQRPLGPLLLCGIGVALSGSIAPLLYLLIYRQVYDDSAR
jgi:hypothetical protein